MNVLCLLPCKYVCEKQQSRPADMFLHLSLCRHKARAAFEAAVKRAALEEALAANKTLQLEQKSKVC